MQTSYKVYFDTLKIIDFIEGLDVDLKIPYIEYN